ncbi:TetR/AcrR family transcriptional regulator C-terminal domain-containing protein [Amycolatopsis sp. A133]|uniref:TetR/AcrR family transcriptional regulator C-terminal domain-containing protein n=1 Tax=Amycolatopsis sp. A133 TaxID=3064472 RepID=UPI0027E61962|nr:TetR/AcrR family transcriptional regulator C-terminal domain-containing protein [Amycolatopsis sp. A133]MDQ7808467.1 TetR/AcrR family transcriptional regulator C-terminal domain-containing protein [Amycolatopsis sp. A133]
MTAEARAPLSRERVLRAAVELADEHGLRAVTMRRLAEELGAEAMSLYYHVAKKEDVLDGIVEVVAEEVNAAAARADRGPDWKQTARRRILAARQVFLRHRWAPELFGTRSSTSTAVLKYYDGLVALMREGGFSHDRIHHALHALGSRALGFSQELFDPNAGASAEVPAELAGRLPNLVAMLGEIAHDDPESTLGWCDDQAEFEFGLDLILDGLDRLRESGD